MVFFCIFAEMSNLKPTFGKLGKPDDPAVSTGDVFYIRYRMDAHDSLFHSGTEMMFGENFKDRNNLLCVIGAELSLFFKKGFR